MKAINLRTGKEINRRPRYATGTDHAEFHVVWRGAWYRLASLSQHLKEKVSPGNMLLVDSRYASHLAPSQEVHISSRI